MTNKIGLLYRGVPLIVEAEQPFTDSLIHEIADSFMRRVDGSEYQLVLTELGRVWGRAYAQGYAVGRKEAKRT